MKKSNPYRTRLIVLLGFLAVVLIFFAVMLFHYQIIKGNSYRLVVKVRFQNGIVMIEWGGTHAEYDKKNFGQ